FGATFGRAGALPGTRRRWRARGRGRGRAVGITFRGAPSAARALRALRCSAGPPNPRRRTLARAAPLESFACSAGPGRAGAGQAAPGRVVRGGEDADEPIDGRTEARGWGARARRQRR